MTLIQAELGKKMLKLTLILAELDGMCSYICVPCDSWSCGTICCIIDNLMGKTEHPGFCHIVSDRFRDFHLKIQELYYREFHGFLIIINRVFILQEADVFVGYGGESQSSLGQGNNALNCLLRSTSLRRGLRRLRGQRLWNR